MKNIAVWEKLLSILFTVCIRHEQILLSERLPASCFLGFFYTWVHTTCGMEKYHGYRNIVLHLTVQSRFGPSRTDIRLTAQVVVNLMNSHG